MRELKKVWLASVVGVVGMMALGASAAAQPLRVVATTGMVADLVTRVGADAVVVEPLMGPGWTRICIERRLRTCGGCSGRMRFSIMA